MAEIADDAFALERPSEPRGDRSARMKTLVIGCGGSGALAATYVKAGLRPNDLAVCIGLDVMSEPPVVISTVNGQRRTTTLETRTEYVVLGRDLDPPHLSSVARAQRQRADGQLNWLLERQPGHRFIKSVEIGTEGERLYGLLALTWSEDDVRTVIEGALRRLNDLRPTSGDAPSGTGINVVLVGSIAGGVGSAIALPVCGMVKDALDRIGVGTHRSLFIYVAIGPDAFPDKGIRLANAFETLTDIAIAQREGIAVCGA